MKLIAPELIEVAVNQSIDQGVRCVQFAQCFQLDEQAFAQVARAYTQWLQRLQLAQHVLDALRLDRQVFRDLLNIGLQVAALVEVAHKLFRDGGIVRRNKRFQLKQQGLGQGLVRWD